MAAITGPLLGGLLSMITDRRASLTALAGLGSAIWLTAMISFTASSPERRTTGGRELRSGVRTPPAPLGVIVLGCTALAGPAALLLRGTVESAG